MNAAKVELTPYSDFSQYWRLNQLLLPYILTYKLSNFEQIFGLKGQGLTKCIFFAGRRTMHTRSKATPWERSADARKRG